MYIKKWQNVMELHRQSCADNEKNVDEELENYLSKISDEALYAYNVYQIEGLGKTLFSNIEGNENTIMGIPVEKIKDYLTLHND